MITQCLKEGRHQFQQRGIKPATLKSFADQSNLPKQTKNVKHKNIYKEISRVWKKGKDYRYRNCGSRIMKRKTNVMPKSWEIWKEGYIFFSLRIMRRAEEGNLGEYSFGNTSTPPTPWQKNSFTTFLKHLLCARHCSRYEVELQGNKQSTYSCLGNLYCSWGRETIYK